VAHLASRRSDGLGLSIFADDEVASLPPRARRDHVGELFKLLEGATPKGTTDALGALESVSARMTRNSLVVLVSDLLDVGEEIVGPLGVLRRRGADILLLHTLDRDELDFPFDGVVRFEDLEGDREVQVDAPGVREAYLEEVKAFLERTQAACAERDVRYLLAPTDRPPAEILRDALVGTALARSGS
jgi:uncharacterized protein (DUF58 family)